MIQRAGDLAALLTNLEPRDVLFIDEIHRLAPAVEEILYPAMEDFQLDLIIGEGPAARSVRIDLPPFTLVGATTRSGLITRPLRERFGIPLRLDVLRAGRAAADRRRAARACSAWSSTPDGAAEIARRSRGTPRVAGAAVAPGARFRRGRRGRARSTPRPPTRRCSGSRSTRAGSTPWTAAISRCIAENYGGGPVGVETMAAALGEQRDVIEEVIEPYLMQQGFVQRTPRGRMLTEPPTAISA